MWLIDLLPGIPSFGLFLAIEIIVSLVFIYWVYLSEHRWV